MEDIEDDIILGNEPEKQTEIATCPSCGANMVFDPENQMLKCDHCGSTVGFDSESVAEQAFEKLLEKNNTWTDETHVFCCHNCGAKEILSKSEIAKDCSFCGTANVVKSEELSGMKPDAVVPFQITKEKAEERVGIWARKKFFAPRKFKRNAHAQEVRGLYNPAFTFDTSTLSVYSGKLGKYHTVTKRVNGKTVVKRVLRYYNISGVYNRFFDDLLVPASTVIEQKTIDKIQPFNTNESKEYKNEFLYGYSATQYSKDGMQCWNDAKTIIDKQVRSGILAKYSYDVGASLKVKTECSKITYKYLLLPIYVGHFKYGKRNYNFFVNGYNGRIAGRMPISPLKVSILIAVLAGLTVGLYFLVNFLGG